MMPATQTPLPISIQRIDEGTEKRIRFLRAWLKKPSSLEGEFPERLARYCIDILMRCEHDVSEKAMEFLHPFQRVPCTRLELLTQEVLTEILTLFFEEAWCRETAPPRKRKTWSQETAWIGQEIGSAVLLNELFEGRLETVEPEGDVRCIWNRLETGIAVNPAHRGVLPPHHKEVFLVERRTLTANKEFINAFVLLKKRFLKSVEAWGLAAAWLAQEKEWKPPPDNWSQVG